MKGHTRKASRAAGKDTAPAAGATATSSSSASSHTRSSQPGHEVPTPRNLPHTPKEGKGNFCSFQRQPPPVRPRWLLRKTGAAGAAEGVSEVTASATLLSQFWGLTVWSLFSYI